MSSQEPESGQLRWISERSHNALMTLTVIICLGTASLGVHLGRLLILTDWFPTVSCSVVALVCFVLCTVNVATSCTSLALALTVVMSLSFGLFLRTLEVFVPLDMSRILGSLVVAACLLAVWCVAQPKVLYSVSMTLVATFASLLLTPVGVWGLMVLTTGTVHLSFNELIGGLLVFHVAFVYYQSIAGQRLVETAIKSGAKVLTVLVE